MKKLVTSFTLLALFLSGIAASHFVVNKTDGTKLYFAISEVDSISFYDINSQEYVDLGLSSGTLWATCNLGANSPEEYGDYFAWGETEPKDDFNWTAYFDTEDGGSTFKKYFNNGGLTELQPEDDAATVKWGRSWQTPSLAQCMELYNSKYTTTTWTTLNGVKGRMVTSKSNSKSIFLPATGFRDGTILKESGENGDYWTRSLSTRYSYFAYDMDGSPNGSWDDGFKRCGGQVVRPVRKQKHVEE